MVIFPASQSLVDKVHHIQGQTPVSYRYIDKFLVGIYLDNSLLIFLFDDIIAESQVYLR